MSHMPPYAVLKDIRILLARRKVANICEVQGGARDANHCVPSLWVQVSRWGCDPSQVNENLPWEVGWVGGIHWEAEVRGVPSRYQST
jgi:hypothetical protein